MEIVQVKIDELELLKDNPRQISKENFERLKRDIKNDPDFLNKRPVLVNKKNGKLIVYAGNMRVKACKELGFNEIPVSIDSDLDEKIMRKRMLIDNQEYGEWDYDILANQWDVEIKEYDLPELDFEKIVGFDSDEKDDIIPEEVPPVAKLGDLWALGGYVECPKCHKHLH